MSEAKSRSSTGFAAAALVLGKVGGKLMPVVAKLGKVLFTGKFLLFASSFGAYALLLSWKFAALIMFALLVHEYGHVWAMKRCGMKVRGVYFIPLMGAAAVPENDFPSRGVESYSAFMGPIWGGLLALVAYVAYLATDSPLLAAAAGWIALVNVFNLLPINPLDGGRIMKSTLASFSSKLGIWTMIGGVALAVSIAFHYGLGLLYFIGFLGIVELLAEKNRLRYHEVAQLFLREYAEKHGVPATMDDVCDHCLSRCNEVSSDFDSEHKIARRRMDEELASMDAFTKLKPRWYPIMRLRGKDWLPHHARDVAGIIPNIRDLAYKYKRAPLIVYMTASKPAMSRGGAIASGIGYFALAGALLAVMYACSHIPGADIAVQFLQ